MPLPQIDPALQSLVADQRDYIAGLDGHFAPPPAVTPPALPATDIALGNSSLRIIRPEGPARAAFLHIHGGGFSQGSAAMMDVANSERARELQVAVASVDYRLAPQHPFPAPLDDCVEAAYWLVDNARTQFGTDILLIGGESVGATLAVLALLRLRDELGSVAPFHAASLVVGIYDFSMTPSQRLSTEQHFLSPTHLAEIRGAAFPGKSLDDLRHPGISPLYAGLDGLPPAVFTVGTADAVLDDTLFMASRWRASGVEAQLELYPEAPHLFMTYPTRMAAEARRRTLRFLRDRIAVNG